jgi:predicted regulator of Ras-like GTPase activity (Roadblock/LC7/MglB family)
LIGEWLAEVDGVNGVRSSFFCDTGGQVIAGSLSPDPGGDVLGNTGHELAQTVAALSTVVGDVGELDLACERARVVVRDLEIGLLGAVCEPGVDIAMLRLMLNVAATRLSDDSDLRSRLQHMTTARDVLDDLDEVSRQLLQALDGMEV